MKNKKFTIKKNYTRDQSPITEKPSTKNKRLLELGHFIDKLIKSIEEFAKKTLSYLDHKKGRSFDKLFSMKKDVIKKTIKHFFKPTITEEQQNHVNILTAFVIKKTTKTRRKDKNNFIDILKEALDSNKTYLDTEHKNIQKTIEYLSQNPQMFIENLYFKDIKREIESILLQYFPKEHTVMPIIFQFLDDEHNYEGIKESFASKNNTHGYYLDMNSNTYVSMNSNLPKHNKPKKTYEHTYQNIPNESADDHIYEEINGSFTSDEHTYQNIPNEPERAIYDTPKPVSTTGKPLIPAAKRNATGTLPIPAKRNATGKPPIPAKHNTTGKSPIPAKRNATGTLPIPAKRNATGKPPIPAKRNATGKPPIPAKRNTKKNPSKNLTSSVESEIYSNISRSTRG